MFDSLGWLIKIFCCRLRIFCAVFVLSVVCSTAPAEIGQWKNYTDMKGVVGIARSGNALWAATHGGLFRYSLDDGSFATLTNSEGLASNDLTAVLADNEGKVWMGASNGAIDIYDPNNQTWQHVVDILLSDKTRKGITGFVLFGDSLYVASEFGVSLFIRSRSEFRETYSKFGSFPSSIRVNSLLVANGRLWVATSSGIASADLTNPNLSAPATWTTVTTAEGIPSNTVNALALFDGTVYAGTNAGLARLGQSSWESVNSVGPRQITGLSQVGSHLYAMAVTDLYSISIDGVVALVGTSLPVSINALADDGSGGVAIGVEGYGLAFLDGSTWSFHYPNGPGSNLFISLKVDSIGLLWAASGFNGQGTGFYSFDNSASPGRQWTDYNATTNPELKFNDYYKVSLGENNSKWISSWGYGVARLDAKGGLAVFDKKAAGFVGIPNDTNFVVIGDVVPDLRGNTWMTVRSAANRNVIAVFRPDSSWFFLQNGLNSNITLLTSMAIDLFDTKWVVSEDASLPGLLYFNDRGTLTNPNDDLWSVLTVDNGLASNTVTRLIVDRDGSVWVGTDLGLDVIVNPGNPKADQAIRRVYIAFDQYINDIAVDPVGNKWVGTKEGVFVLSPDATSLIAQYTVENTGGKLIDNDVRAVAFDDKRGIAYFGTEKGLSSLTTDAIAPQASFDKLRVCPQLLYVPVEHATSGKSDCGGEKTGVVISGLVENTGLKILSIDGRLVRELDTPGGGIGRWDGKDDNGHDVSSGVYIIVAYSEDGSKVAIGKVAVLRK
jgi:ligand-binding sensor domain-containing protein